MDNRDAFSNVKDQQLLFIISQILFVILARLKKLKNSRNDNYHSIVSIYLGLKYFRRTLEGKKLYNHIKMQSLY